MYAMSRTMCRERLRLLLPLIAGALFTACASGGAGNGAEAPTPSISLVVENHSWGPVTVYLSASGLRLRIGVVDGMSTRGFPLDRFRSAMEGHDVYLIARPLAGQPFRSQDFLYSPGRTTIWTVENQSALSQVVVR
jgi:hypothetical protein